MTRKCTSSDGRSECWTSHLRVRDLFPTFCGHVIDRVLRSPGALAYRVHDSTIKAVDSHLRINGVVGDLSCRDVPLRMRHSFPSHSGRQASVPDYGGLSSDEDGVYTSDLEELLELISSKG